MLAINPLGDDLTDESTSKSKNRQSRVKLTNTVKIRTVIDGHNAGRVYYIRTDTGAECRRITDEISAYSAVARKRFQLRTRWEQNQDQLKAIYDSLWVQGLVAVLILSVKQFFVLILTT